MNDDPHRRPPCGRRGWRVSRRRPAETATSPDRTGQYGTRVRPAPHRLSRRVGTLAALSLALAGAAACSGDDTGDGATTSSITVAATTSAVEQSDPTMPDWIQRVRPEPDAADSAERAVSVDAVNLPEGRELRLRIDGIDVTAQALVSEPTGTAGPDGQPATNDRLRYDPRDTPTAPLVELAPGGHSATAELRERGGFGNPTRLIDSYTWHFVVQ